MAISGYLYDYSGVGLDITFTSTYYDSVAPPDSWEWDFGDGNTSSSQNPPTHTYAASDQYVVKVVVGRTANNQWSVTNTFTIIVPLPEVTNPVNIEAPTLQVDDLVLPNSCDDTTYPTQTFTASGGIPPYSFAWGTAGGPEPAFPVGMSNTLTFNNATQVMSGFASTGSPIDENFILRINVNSADSQSAFKDFPYTIWANPIVSTTSLPDGVSGVAYSETLLYSGAGAAVTNWTITAGALPGGLTLHAATGVIDGTPDPVAGNFAFTVKGESVNGCFDTQALSINITLTNLIVDPITLPGACRDVAYSQTLTASNGVPPYTWAIIAGGLPDWLALDTNTGEISGTTAVDAVVTTYDFTVEVTDDAANTADRPLSIEVFQEPVWVTTSPLPSGNANVPYSIFFEATGAVGYGFNSGTPPFGLNIEVGTGELHGTPTLPGDYTFEMAAVSAEGCLSYKTFDINIGSAPPTVSGLFYDVCNSSNYAVQLTTVGGVAPLVFSLSSGLLPEQVTLNYTTGEIKGITAQAGIFNFDITVTDAIGLSSTTSFSFEVFDTPVVVNPVMPPGVYGTPYSYTFESTGGTPPKMWILYGSLPSGLLFNSIYGTISGTPLASGNFPLSIGVQDINSCVSQKDALLVITGPPDIVTSSLPPACQNQEYGANSPVYITVQGGLPPYYWFIASDNYPPQDLVLNPYTGQITGIPLVPGTYTFTVKVVDSNDLYATKDYTLIVRTEKECGQPDEGETVTVTKERLISIESDPVVVMDPFHQKHLHEYLPAPFAIKNE